MESDTLRNNLDAALRENRVSRKAASIHLGYHEGYISDFMTGRQNALSLPDIEKLATLLKMTAAELLGMPALAPAAVSVPILSMTPDANGEALRVRLDMVLPADVARQIVRIAANHT